MLFAFMSSICPCIKNETELKSVSSSIIASYFIVFLCVFICLDLKLFATLNYWSSTTIVQSTLYIMYYYPAYTLVLQPIKQSTSLFYILPIVFYLLYLKTSYIKILIGAMRKTAIAIMVPQLL